MAKQRYYGEKFKATKGAFGNKSKYLKSLEQQAELRKQIAEFEAKKEKANATKQNSETKKVTAKETETKKTETENVSTATE